MEAKDGSFGFDFSGKHTRVEQHKQIETTLDDGRNMQVLFFPRGDVTAITEAFEAEQENSIELQKEGWQAILNNFKKYVEAPDRKEIVHFEILINADVKKVFKDMLDEKKYSEWTSLFEPGISFRGGLEERLKDPVPGNRSGWNYGGYGKQDKRKFA